MTPDPLLSDDALAALVRRSAAELPDVPASMLRAAIGLFPAAPAAQPLLPQAWALLRQVLGALRFDSAGLSPLALGVRGGEDGTRHLLFSAEGRDVDLRIQPDGAGHWAVSGQVLGPDEVGEVCLSALGANAAPPAVHQAALDTLGEFALPAVPAGRWALALRLGADVVILPPLDLGPAP
jgi:hypothetical protein